MIKAKGDFYFPKSREVSPIGTQNRPSKVINNSLGIESTLDHFNSTHSNDGHINHVEETKGDE